MPLTKNQIKRAIFIFPFISLPGLIYLKLNHNQFYRELLKEDHFFENLQALLYLTSAIISFYIWRKLLKRSARFLALSILFLSAGLLFIFLEEISWFQRILSIESSAYFIEHNHQNETNLHNMKFFMKYNYYLFVGIGLYGGLAWIFLRWFPFKQYVAPAWYISPYFLLCSLIYYLIAFTHFYFGMKLGIEKYKITKTSIISWRDQEIAETFLALVLQR